MSHADQEQYSLGAMPAAVPFQCGLYALDLCDTIACAQCNAVQQESLPVDRQADTGRMAGGRDSSWRKLPCICCHGCLGAMPLFAFSLSKVQAQHNVPEPGTTLSNHHGRSSQPGQPTRRPHCAHLRLHAPKGKVRYQRLRHACVRPRPPGVPSGCARRNACSAARHGPLRRQVLLPCSQP